MKKEDALKKAANLCSRQEKCEYDIRTKLQEWQCNETDTENIILKLKQEKFLDNERFAGTFVRSKFRYNSWGRNKIKYMLIQKQISTDLIETALHEIDAQEYIDTLKKIIYQKAKGIRAKNDFDKKVKLTRFAVSKGFENELIQEIIEFE